jgi:hypothetical protein
MYKECISHVGKPCQICCFRINSNILFFKTRVTRHTNLIHESLLPQPTHTTHILNMCVQVHHDDVNHVTQPPRNAHANAVAIQRLKFHRLHSSSMTKRARQHVGGQRQRLNNATASSSGGITRNASAIAKVRSSGMFTNIHQEHSQ